MSNNSPHTPSNSDSPSTWADLPAHATVAPGDGQTAGAPSNAPQTEGFATWAAAARRVLRQPRFVMAALFLLVSGVGLNATAQFLQLHFRKVAVPLPVRSLSDEEGGVPARLGDWVQASTDEPLDPEIEGQLGTKQYINRWYLDSRLDPSAATLLRTASKKERADRLNDYVARYSHDPKGASLVPALYVGLTYYTGLVDTVAHIPDRCYIANGYDQLSTDVVSMPSDSFADHKPRDVRFRFCGFEDQTGQDHGVFVAYFFKVNGKYTDDPLQVRRALQDLTEKYGYYAKVEIRATSNDLARSQTLEYKTAVEKAIKDFIAVALPQIDSRLPDWERVTSN